MFHFLCLPCPVYESFKEYIAIETLDGDNKYDAGKHGLQDAEKGLIFVSLPPILHLHLMRFQYDALTGNSFKFNDRFEFYEHINLDPYLKTAESQPAAYTLHAVLVHSGDNHAGHYVVYINPLANGEWCQFDDDVVSRCTKFEAIEHNYGGVDDDVCVNARICSNAYMLVYIRDAAMPMVLQEIQESEIPDELTERLRDEQRIEVVRRRERVAASTFMTVNVLFEDFFESNDLANLCDTEKCRTFKVNKTQTMAELMEIFADTMKVSVHRMRVWPMVQRHNETIRPAWFDIEENIGKSIEDCAYMQSPWIVFLEMLLPDSPLKQLPSFDKKRDTFLFFKCYDPVQKRLNYCGQGYYDVHNGIADLVPEMCDRVGWPTDTILTVYEEVSFHAARKIFNHSDTLDEVRMQPGSSYICTLTICISCLILCI